MANQALGAYCTVNTVGLVQESDHSYLAVQVALFSDD
jgi:hypothetical protein